MNVVFCAYDFPNFLCGPNSWLLRLLPALRALGVHVRVLFIADSPELCPTIYALQQMGFDYRTFSPFRAYTDRKISWILREVADFSTEVFVPNVVLPAYYAIRWTQAAGIPSVGVLHSDDAFHHALRDEFVTTNTAWKVSAVVCVSRTLEEDVLARNPAGLSVRRIPCGVPVPVERARFGEPFRVAYVGRLVEEQKRVTEVARSFRRLVTELPGTEALFFGDGPSRPQLEKFLQTEAAGLPIRLCGRVEPSEIQRHLLTCHAVALLSDYEGLPISVMEAMACGVVPVCLRIRSGVTELVEHEVNGLLVENRGDAFVRAIARLRSERTLWESLSKGARARIEAEYSDAISVQRWYELFCELKERTGQAGRIRIPWRISLPPVHPALAREDFRLPPPLSRLVARGKSVLRRASRRFRRRL